MDEKVDPKRSYIMSRVRHEGTDIELTLRKALWHKGYRYRKNYRKLPGSPDIAITKYCIAIFCDAEFWHGKDWDEAKAKLNKGSNAEYWIRKIERNRERDVETDRNLRALGWTVLRFWGKDILKHTDECVRVVEETIFDIRIKNNEPLDVDDEEYGKPINNEQTKGSQP